MNSLQQLKKKHADLLAWLGTRLADLRELRRRRDADLRLSYEAIAAAQRESDRLHRVQDERKTEAYARLELAETLLETARDLQQAGQDLLTAACGMDTGEGGITAARGMQRAEHLAWRDRFRQEQDGRTRRKRGELAKVARRIAEKEAAASRHHATSEEIQYGKGFDSSYGTSPGGEE
jgi:hypothetical protein